VTLEGTGARGRSEPGRAPPALLALISGSAAFGRGWGRGWGRPPSPGKPRASFLRVQLRTAPGSAALHAASEAGRAIPRWFPSGMEGSLLIQPGSEFGSQLPRPSSPPSFFQAAAINRSQRDRNAGCFGSASIYHEHWLYPIGELCSGTQPRDLHGGAGWCGDHPGHSGRGHP